MGTSRTPQYRVEFVTDNGYWTPAEWKVKTTKLRGQGYGAPTVENLKAHCLFLEESCRAGANKHLGETKILSAKIVHQESYATVASYTRAS